MRRYANDENSLVRKIQASLGLERRDASSSLRLGIGDDAALWRPSPGREVVLTCDWFLEGVHFRRDAHPADSVGWKCLARAVSDIAAMGGTPRCFLLSLALPESHIARWMDDLLSGLRRASREFRCPPAGGDTTRSNEILISITAVGEVESRNAALRSGARPGDLIGVSGRLGEAQLGLELLLLDKSAARTKCQAMEKHLYPFPRVEIARRLAAQELVTSMMDVSDGLAMDLRRLCAASGVGATIDEESLPLASPTNHPNVSRQKRLDAALHGGDDYELLFTVSRNERKSLPRRVAGVPLTIIGEIQAGRGIFLLGRDGRRAPLETSGWDPFQIGTKNKS